MENYPPNRNRDKETQPEDKNIKQVTSSEAIRRKKPLRKQFKETFFGGNAKTAAQFTFFGVLIPAAQDMFIEAGSQWLERLVRGDTRRRGGSTPSSGPMGYVNYHRMSSRPQEPINRMMSRRARTIHDFDEIILPSRSEAEDVIDGMFDIVSRYGQASVADLYALVGIKPDHTDYKWGWEELRGADVARVRNGYLLDLTEPKPLD